MIIVDLYNHNMLQPKFYVDYNLFILYNSQYVDRINRGMFFRNRRSCERVQYDAKIIAELFHDIAIDKGDMLNVMDSLLYLNRDYKRHIITKERSEYGRAVQMLRTYGKQKLTIGYAPTSSVCYPETDRPEDIKAARKAYFSLQEDDSNWTWNVSWWSDPVLFGHYPEEGLERYEKYLPKITEEDMRLISEPIDIYGQNIYNGRCFRMGEDGKSQEVCRYEGFPKTAIQWPVTPECLRWGPKFLYERYHKPIYITESGLSCHDVISLDGKVHDPNRIDFLARYLRELKKAAEEVDIRGYFQWSLMDNFEWAKGYSDRFGFVYVDYRNQQRIMKDSAFWYKHVIETNGVEL